MECVLWRQICNCFVLFSSCCIFLKPVNDFLSWNRVKDIRLTPTYRFDRHQLFKSDRHICVVLINTNISTARSTYVKLTFREEHCDNSHLQNFRSAKYEISWTRGWKLRITHINRWLVPSHNSALFASKTLTFLQSQISAALGSSPTYFAGGQRSGPICTAQQDFFIYLLFLRYPWAGHDPDQCLTRTRLRSKSTILSTWTCSVP